MGDPEQGEQRHGKAVRRSGSAEKEADRWSRSAQPRACQTARAFARGAVWWQHYYM
jgi:hypothetical protein